MRDKADGAKSAASEPAELTMNGLDDLIGTKIRYAYLMMRRSFSQRLGPLGLTQTQCATMWMLEANPGVSQTELADILDVDRITMIGVIENLSKNGLISRTRSTTDGRRRNLTLSEKGKELFAEAKKQILEHDYEFANRISSGEVAILKEILGKFSNRN